MLVEKKYFITVRKKFLPRACQKCRISTENIKKIYLPIKCQKDSFTMLCKICTVALKMSKRYIYHGRRKKVSKA